MNGAVAQTLAQSTARPRADIPRGTPEWITSSIVEKTIKIWEKRAGIPISSEEAVGIILRVSTLMDVLSRR